MTPSPARAQRDGAKGQGDEFELALLTLFPSSF
jgi:hypothetical protein